MRTGTGSRNRPDFGLMQVNNFTLVEGWPNDSGGRYPGLLNNGSPFFKNLQGYKSNDALWKTNPFGNIGAAIGIILNGAMRPNGTMYNQTPSLKNWQDYIFGYNRRKDGEITNCDAYYKCWLRFLRQINPRIVEVTDFNY